MIGKRGPVSILVAAGLALAVLFQGAGHAPVSAAGGRAQELRASFQAAIDSRRVEFNVPGVSAAVILGDGSRWAGVSGRASMAPDTSVESNTPFVLGSITKTFVASLILELRDDGLLELDDPLSDWLPGYPDAANITIRQLLSHTSGVFDYFAHSAYNSAVFGNPSRHWTPQEVLETFTHAPYFPPGTDYHYSNTNFVLLGLVAEAAGGATIATQLQNRFWTPLHLDHTSIQSQGPPPAAAARGFLLKNGVLRDVGDSSGYRPSESAATVAWSVGDVVASAPDVASWAHALYGGHVLEAHSLAEMTDWQANPGDGGYGLGTRAGEYDGRLMFGHTGSLRGYVAVSWHVPSEDATFVVLTNRGRSNSPDVMVNDLMNIAFSAPDTVAPSVPDNLKAVPRSGRYVTITWTPASDNMPGTIRYRVFRDGLALARTTTLQLIDRPSVGRHSYTVRAIDVVGNKSAQSPPVTARAFR